MQNLFVTSSVLLAALLSMMPGLCRGQNTTAESEEEIANNHKLSFFDKQGVLVIRGSVNGTSEAITVDRKPLQDRCSNRPYYVFTVCPENPFTNDTLRVGDEVCNEGIIFCYEGQLKASRVKEHFILPRVSGEINEQCKEFDGFKIALRQFVKMAAYNKTRYLFMEIKTSYMDESYYFPLPYSQCLDLYLGHEYNILTAVRDEDNENKMVRPVQVIKDDWSKEGFYYEGTNETKLEKQFEDDFMSLPDSKKMERYETTPHLKMLYMDFRAPLFSPQTMMAIVPHSCNLIIRARGNLVKACKADWKQKNFALRSLNYEETSTEYALTIESGTEDWSNSGTRSGKSKASSQSSETGGSTVDETSKLSGLQRESEATERQGSDQSDTKQSQTKTDASATGKADGTVGGEGYGGSGSIEGGVQYEQSTSSIDSFQRHQSRMSHKSSSETSITSSSSIIENAFKNTETSIDTQSKQTFNSHSVGVTKKTIYKWKVKVPPGKVMVPMQMSMDCDGASVKIPWMRFELRDEDEDLQSIDYDSSDGKFY